MRSLISILLSRTEKQIEAERMRCTYHLTGASKCSLQHMCHKVTAVACSANTELLLRHAGSSVTKTKRQEMAASDQFECCRAKKKKEIKVEKRRRRCVP